MDVISPRWRKSSHSDSGSCVEVADNIPGRVLVQDTKDRDGGTLTFSPSSWSSFVGMAKRTTTARDLVSHGN